MKKKKVAIIATTGVLATSLAVGGATYALFTSSTTNAGNAFTAGTLKIDSARDDIPMTGPMFYTESPSNVTGIGGLATGVWAPGDTNTRGLFLHNSGTLGAKLVDLTATPVGYSGKDGAGNSVFSQVTSGSQYDTDMAFASQATVTIWEVGKFDPSNDEIYSWDPDLSANDIDIIMQTLNAAYTTYETMNPGDAYTLTEYAQILDGDFFHGAHVYYGNAQMLDQVNKLAKQNSSGISVADDFQVTKVMKMKLTDFINNGGTAGLDICVPKGGTELLAYSVNFNRNAGNEYQGITPYFNFGSDWAQSRNNP